MIGVLAGGVYTVFVVNQGLSKKSARRKKKATAEVQKSSCQASVGVMDGAAVGRAAGRPW
jgi:hypothetical protein